MIARSKYRSLFPIVNKAYKYIMPALCSTVQVKVMLISNQSTVSRVKYGPRLLI